MERGRNSGNSGSKSQGDVNWPIGYNFEEFFTTKFRVNLIENSRPEPQQCHSENNNCKIRLKNHCLFQILAPSLLNFEALDKIM